MGKKAAIEKCERARDNNKKRFFHTSGMFAGDLSSFRMPMRKKM